MRPTQLFARPAWYDHNGEVYLPAPRIANDPDAFRNLHRHQNSNTMDWYRHEHSDNHLPSKLKLRSDSAALNARRMQSGTRPEWISSGDADDVRDHSHTSQLAMPRLPAPEGHEYRERNRNGSASQWWTHDNVSALPQPTYRVASQEGYDNASRARHKSENWFDYSPEDNPPQEAPRPRLLSVTALALRDRGHGQIQRVIQQQQENEDDNIEAKILPKVHSEGHHIRQLHLGTNIAKLFSQVAEEVRTTPPRRLPPEAEEIKHKYQGVAAEVFQGYLDPPVKHRGRRITSDGKINEMQHKDHLHDVMNFNGNCSPDMCITGRPLRPRPPGASISASGQHIAEVFAQYGRPAPPPSTVRGINNRRHMGSNVGRLLLQPQAFR